MVNYKTIIFYICLIALFIIVFRFLGWRAVIGFFMGTLITALTMIHYLYKKNTTVRAGIDLLSDKLEEDKKK